MTSRMHRSFTVIALICAPSAVLAQAPAPRPTGRVSFYVTTDLRRPDGSEASANADFATSFTFRTPEMERQSLDVGIDIRHTAYTATSRPQRVSIYDGFVGARLGAQGQLRVRAGHMWMPDMGSAGALAGGLVEFRTKASGSNSRLIGGVFAGAEPLGYSAGYAEGIRKYGGYMTFESGFLRRHSIGFANIRHGAITERTTMSVANYLPVGKSFFAYQAMEYDVTGPANGAAKSGLSYFLLNARATASSRVELQGTYNRGRSIDARQLTDDVLNGRPLNAKAIDGLRYETAGGRVSVKVARGLEFYGGYARDRNNRDDAATGRITLGGYSTNLFGSGLDVSASDARINRPSGPYHSRFVSVGRAFGRSLYGSVDFSTSLAVVRYLRSDGVVIETKPWSRRLSGNVSATINRTMSWIGVADFTMDEGLTDFRLMTGLTFRLR
jgi:hypothetical protein